MIRYLIYLETLLLFRRPQDWLYSIVFFLMVMCLFPLIFTPDPLFLQKYMPGCVWLTTLFACFLSIQSVFDTDYKEGFLEQLLLTNAPTALIILIKLLIRWALTIFPLLMLMPLIAFIFHLSFNVIMSLALGLLLGTPILIFLSSLGVSLTLTMQQQSVLLGLLILPLSTPILIFGVSIVQQTQAGLPITAPFAFLAGLSLLSVVFLPFAIAAALQIAAED